VGEKRGDAELASVMRKVLTLPGPQGYGAIDVGTSTLDLDVEGVQLTEDEQQAIEEVWNA